MYNLILFGTTLIGLLYTEAVTSIATVYKYSVWAPGDLRSTYGLFTEHIGYSDWYSVPLPVSGCNPLLKDT